MRQLLIGFIAPLEFSPEIRAITKWAKGEYLEIIKAKDEKSKQLS